MFAVIDVADLHKRFAHVRALNGLDLQVGERYAETHEAAAI